MSTRKTFRHAPARPPRRLIRVRDRLQAFNYVASGSLARRMMVCGKAQCRCKQDPPRLHGPYHYWGRREKGKLVQRLLGANQAKSIGKAIRDYRRMMQIVRGWEEETVRALGVI